MADKDTIVREEFEHLIAEFEAFKDNYMDEMLRLSQQMEIFKEELDEMKQLLKESGALSPNQRRL